uniref:Uncharacterized protein n=1 Tax=Globisporangium ultimum (strain ATCC 200006 / CBS 805.95 / DAOM BR144) TaxID=431595 RepID=K3WI29_GLOUD
MSARNAELFGLTDKDLEALHQFVIMRRTLMNLQRSLDNFNSVGIDIMQQRKNSYVSERGGSTRSIRRTDNIEQSIEQKCNAITDTLLQFSLVIEKLQDAPPGFEALVDDPVQALVAGT